MTETQTPASINMDSRVGPVLAKKWSTANWILIVVLCLIFVGCGPRAGNPRPLDRALAMDSMKLFLETWRDQGSPDSLKTRSPSIVVQDDDWAAGHKLVSFEIPESGDDDGSNLYLDVKLKLQEKTGQENNKSIRYVIGTKPVVSIFRDN